MNRQDWAKRSANDCFRHAAHHDVSEPGSAVGAHDDHVEPAVTGSRNNFLRGRAMFNDHAHLDGAVLLCVRAKLFEPALSNRAVSCGVNGVVGARHNRIHQLRHLENVEERDCGLKRFGQRHRIAHRGLRFGREIYRHEDLGNSDHGFTGQQGMRRRSLPHDLSKIIGKVSPNANAGDAGFPEGCWPLPRAWSLLRICGDDVQQGPWIRLGRAGLPLVWTRGRRRGCTAPGCG